MVYRSKKQATWNRRQCEYYTNNWEDIIKMRYSAESKYEKYVKGYEFLSFARRFGDKFGKKLKDAVTKTGIDDTKTASKRVVQNTAKVTRDLIGNRIADKITSVGKTKSKEKEEMYIPPEKIQQIIDDLRWLLTTFENAKRKN